MGLLACLQWKRSLCWVAGSSTVTDFSNGSLNLTDLLRFTKSLSKVNTVTLLLCLFRDGEGIWLAFPMKRDTKKIITSVFVAGT